MKQSSKVLKIALISAIFLTGFVFSPGNNSVKQKAEIVLCLDLSASTNGLLNDIRDNLWQFINYAKRSYPGTHVRIGIVVFARPSFGAENFYVKVLCDLTEDYDLASYYLFTLTANVEKGDQCDGSALYAALKDLHWSEDAETKKMIYLFGNSNVKMCGYDYRKACEIALKDNITVHAVYSTRGEISQKYLHLWNEIAELTGGDFYTYQITKRSALKRASGDAQWLAEINERLGDTYIYYTKEGKLHYDLMIAADENSKKMSEQFFYSRCAYKFSPHFEEQCRQWDLVTLVKSTVPDFTKLNRNYLPPEFQNATPKELKEIAQIKLERRESLAKQIQNVVLNSSSDHTYVNTVDSILLSGLNKKLIYVVSQSVKN